MKSIIAALNAAKRVSAYKINGADKKTSELFFVKGRLETVRATDTRDRLVTVYVDHDGFRGDATFRVFPSTKETDLPRLIDDAVNNALVINNKPYELPAGEQGEYEVASNFSGHALPKLAEDIAKNVFASPKPENGALNSVEVFVERCTERVVNSHGIDKVQTRYSAMVEAIPTYNGEGQSVELYQMYKFNEFDPAAIRREIGEKLMLVCDRCAAEKPATLAQCPVMLNKHELAELFGTIAGELNYKAVYQEASLLRKGASIEADMTGDPVTLTMRAEARGDVASACFDGDGLSLKDICLIERGKVMSYFGDNRFGQYLNEAPSGEMRCVSVAPGTLDDASQAQGLYLDIASMSGLQVDFFNDYIGGEVRLAYYCDGTERTPVTGISISGKLSEVLPSIRLSRETCVTDCYTGPDKAMLSGMKIY